MLIFALFELLIKLWSTKILSLWILALQLDFSTCLCMIYSLILCYHFSFSHSFHCLSYYRICFYSMIIIQSVHRVFIHCFAKYTLKLTLLLSPSFLLVPDQTWKSFLIEFLSTVLLLDFVKMPHFSREFLTFCSFLLFLNF